MVFELYCTDTVRCYPCILFLLDDYNLLPFYSRYSAEDERGRPVRGHVWRTNYQWSFGRHLRRKPSWLPRSEGIADQYNLGVKTETTVMGSRYLRAHRALVSEVTNQVSRNTACDWTCGWLIRYGIVDFFNYSYWLFVSHGRASVPLSFSKSFFFLVLYNSTSGRFLEKDMIRTGTVVKQFCRYVFKPSAVRFIHL